MSQSEQSTQDASEAAVTLTIARGVSGCPSSNTFRGWVTELSGPNARVQGAAHVFVSTEAKDQLVATIAVSGASAEPLGERRLASTVNCQELLKAAALVASLTLSPRPPDAQATDSSVGLLSAGADPTREDEPPDSPTELEASEPPESASGLEAREPPKVKPASPPEWWLGASLFSGYGSVPRFGLGPLVSLGVRSDQLAVGLNAGAQSSIGAASGDEPFATATNLETTLDACWLLVGSGLQLCGTAGALVMFARGEGFSVDRAETLWSPLLGGGLQSQLKLSEQYGVRFKAEALVPTAPVSLASAPSESTIWTMNPVTLRFSVGVDLQL